MGLSVIQRAVLKAFEDLRMPRGSVVLDAPCGDGPLVVAVRDAGHDAHGVDIDTVGAAGLGSAYRRADLNAGLPFPDGTFDLVFSIEGIEHLENRFGFLRELRRTLKPGGTLILTTPNIVGLRSRVRFFASGFYHRDSRPLREAAHHPLHHISLSTLADLRYALHTSGFRLARVAHTHVKPVSYLYAWLVPWMWLYTAIAFRKERDTAQRAANREVRAALFSRSVLFGENLLLVATRAADAAAWPREDDVRPPTDQSGEIDGRPQSSQRK
ncbi:MAG: class I SAM-dependent methyltransferase [Acidobacteriota bacterium]